MTKKKRRDRDDARAGTEQPAAEDDATRDDAAERASLTEDLETGDASRLEEEDEDSMGNGVGDDTALTDELEGIRAELDEARGDKLRLLAEFKNYRQRVERERLEVRSNAVGDLFRRLLPIVHDLERAREATTADASTESIAQGIDLVLRRLGDLLAKEGVTEVDPLGEPFDEATMEAMGMMPSTEQPEGSVAQVFQRGLVLGDRLIEPARVLVSSGPPESPQPDGADEERP